MDLLLKEEHHQVRETAPFVNRLGATTVVWATRR